MMRVILLAYFVGPLIVFAQFNITTYSVVDGLAQSQVYAMLEDSRGFIWMGTDGGGISQFDGKKFKNFSKKDGLSDNRVLAIYESKKGNIWIGTKNGLCIYNGIKFEDIEIEEEQEIEVNCFLEDKSGQLWLGTSKGIYQYKDGVFENWSLENNLFKKDISDLYEHIDGSIWACNGNGILQIAIESNVLYGLKDGLSHTATCHFVGDSTGIYISTLGGGLIRFNEGKFSTITREFENIHDMFLEDGIIWLTSLNKGILRLDLSTNQSQIIDETQGLSNNHTRTIIKDSWGNFWFSTSGDGVNKYFGPEFEHLTESDGLEKGYVYDVHVAFNNDIWTAHKHSIVMKNQDTTIVYNRLNGYTGGKARVLTEDHLGNIWIGTDLNAVYCFNGNEFHQFTRNDGIPGENIQDIMEDQLQNIWVSTIGGIAKLEPLAPNDFHYLITQWSRELNLGNRPIITNLEEDTLGRIWFSSKKDGIGYFLDEKISNPTEGLPAVEIKTMQISPTGDLWIGTHGEGIYVASASEPLISFSLRNMETDGLTSDLTFLIEFDKKGHAWIGSEQGVDRIEFGELNTIKQIKHFGKDEGFKGVETNRNASCVDNNGNVWFGTIDGLMKYNPKKATKNTLAPKLSLSNVALFYKDLAQTKKYKERITNWHNLTDSLILNHTENHISFEFKGINQKNPDKVYYEFILEGFDPKWSPISEKNDATYSNLPPGFFKFKVRAGNEDNVWTEKPIEFVFTITPPFWKTSLFIFGSTGLGVLLLTLLIAIRISAIKKKISRDQKAIEMERTMLELEQKALRLQMNPHFIFNSINSVQAFILRNDQKSARYYLAKFSKLMRQTLENSRNQLVTISDEINSLKNYLELENFGRTTPFKYTIEVGQEIDPDNVLIPAILLQPFAENAIIHGFKKLDRVGNLDIKFSAENDTLICEITDNGIGRSEAKKQKAQIDQQHKSAALVVTQERLNILNKNGSQKGFEIVDIMKNDVAFGTTVILRMPLNEKF
jgi:ligand-binding sensor domain-containing protein